MSDIYLPDKEHMIFILDFHLKYTFYWDIINIPYDLSM